MIILVMTFINIRKILAFIGNGKPPFKVNPILKE